MIRCGYSVFIWEHQDGGCDRRGEGRVCSTNGGQAIELKAGNTNPQGNSRRFEWESDFAWDGAPRALIISRPKDHADPNMHVELKYGLSQTGGHLRWSITPGRAFADENVRLTPWGPNYKSGDCKIVRCRKTDQAFCTDGPRTDVPRFHVSYELGTNLG